MKATRTARNARSSGRKKTKRTATVKTPQPRNPVQSCGSPMRVVGFDVLPPSGSLGIFGPRTTWLVAPIYSEVVTIDLADGTTKFFTIMRRGSEIELPVPGTAAHIYSVARRGLCDAAHLKGGGSGNNDSPVILPRCDCHECIRLP